MTHPYDSRTFDLNSNTTQTIDFTPKQVHDLARVAGAARRLLEVLPPFPTESNVNAWVYTLAQALKQLDGKP